MGWRLNKAISNQGAPCVICGSYENENAAKKVNIIAMERKEIPLCKKHPLEMHVLESLVTGNCLAGFGGSFGFMFKDK
ncbi:hypothetical protein HDU92_000961 [Lobulomyces angularis]|nr:hypothetical protein HDU92_000961 [Lobulomyces angularis]